MTEQANPNVEAAPEFDSRAQSESDLGNTDASTKVDDIETLQTRLAEAQSEATANQDKFLRARADMENYKKRIARTYADSARATKKDLLTKMLVVKDNLERALQYGEASPTGEGLLEGVRLTQYQLDQLLEREGVKIIEALGNPFDPYLAEAIQSVRDPSIPDHTVVQVVRTGYTLDDEVLRPAQVIVNVHDEDA